ncbi:MAG: hypothetical protein N2745_00450 [Syntrophorhabdaceae bacterium]|nr:hypothetical protein [Syntrophorhabdaceae bacterium]
MVKIFILILFFPVTLYAFWPFYWEFDGEKRFLGPLISYSNTEGRTSLTVRPIISYVDSDEGRYYRYLYPLGMSSKGFSYFIPFYMKREGDPASKRDNTSFLLFFNGMSEKGEYGGFFPFYGRFYDRFGADEMGFFMWPLFSYTEKDGAEKKSFLWPFFSLYGGKETGFKVWPLYGKKEEAGTKSSYFFMWPLIYGEKDIRQPDNPVEKFFAVPFFLKSVSKSREEYMVLFPLYSSLKDEDKQKVSILWPLSSFTKGKGIDSYSIFPIIASDKREDYTSFSFMWPFIYMKTEWTINENQFFRHRFLLLNRFISDEEGYFRNIWPFFEFNRTGAGGTKIGAPSLLPFRSPDFDRIVKPLYTLIEKREREERDAFSFLYGFYTKETDGKDWRARLAFIFDIRKESGEMKFELFSGLFGFDRDRIKIFFIPFERKRF